MARLPKCASCENCNIWNGTCEKYPKGIPNRIYIEIEECNDYKLMNEQKDEFVEYPIAKGRYDLLTAEYMKTALRL